MKAKSLFLILGIIFLFVSLAGAKLNVVGEVNFSSSSVTTFTEGGALVVSG